MSREERFLRGGTTVLRHKQRHTLQNADISPVASANKIAKPGTSDAGPLPQLAEIARDSFLERSARLELVSIERVRTASENRPCEMSARRQFKYYLKSGGASLPTWQALGLAKNGGTPTIQALLEVQTRLTGVRP